MDRRLDHRATLTDHIDRCQYLAAVAPGVAEALVATAAALSVAIPATFGYNILANRLNRLDNQLESFGTTLIALLGREGRL